MSSLMIIIIFKATQSVSPLSYSLMILGSSVVISLLLFKASLVSWASLVLIMIFSSGIMTLFVYISSLSPQEKSKSKMLWIHWILLMLVGLNPQEVSLGQSKQVMKVFSSQIILVIMTLFLILTMLVISLQSFNPQQSMASTF